MSTAPRTRPFARAIAYAQTGMLPANLFQRLAFVSVGVIQQHDHRTGEMAEQMPQE
jgi:hypothetical protein